MVMIFSVLCNIFVNSEGNRVDHGCVDIVARPRKKLQKFRINYTQGQLVDE